MRRETTFRVGGWLLIAVGAGLGVDLGLAGAGLPAAGIWFAAGGSVGFGAFCLFVAHDAARFRTEYHDAVESGRPPPPGAPPP